MFDRPIGAYADTLEHTIETLATYFEAAKLMKIGDSVLTHHGERGTIIKPWGGACRSFDWWVDVHFTIGTEQITTRIMYKESNLKKI